MRKQTGKSMQSSTIQKIMRKTANEVDLSYEPKFVQNTLRKIYSEQFAKALNGQKFIALVDQHKQELEQTENNKNQQRITSIYKLQKKSQQRRDKLLRDRLKTYEAHDRQWVAKTQDIKHKLREEERSMRQEAEHYRIRSQTEWKHREQNNINRMKELSSKHHYMLNNPSQLHLSESFDQHRLEELMRKRKRNVESHKRSRSIERDIQFHREKENQLTKSQSSDKFQKLISKLQKMEKIEQKKTDRLKTESLARAKQKLNQKIYKNSKSQIGPQCDKHSQHQDRFRVRTLQDSTTPSKFRSSFQNFQVRHSQVTNNETVLKREKTWLEECRKARRAKITRVMKANVKHVLTSQFKNRHCLSHLSSS